MSAVFCAERFAVGELDAGGHLKALLQTCGEAEAGFRHCASNADRMSFQLMMTQRATVWHRWTSDLRALSDDNALPATASRASMRSNAALTDCSDLALLAECERIEQAALQRYRNVLEQDLPRVVRAVLQRHVDGIQRSRADLRSLRADTVLARV